MSCHIRKFQSHLNQASNIYQLRKFQSHSFNYVRLLVLDADHNQYPVNKNKLVQKRTGSDQMYFIGTYEARNKHRKRHNHVDTENNFKK